jgi:superfamily II DNA helicase RecQ
MVVPAYVVASDRLLETLATAKPRNRAALRQLQGIGLKKDEQFGEAIVGIIQRVTAESGA